MGQIGGLEHMPRICFNQNAIKSIYGIWDNGAPEEIRTPDPQIRSLVLYPAELRVHIVLSFR